MTVGETLSHARRERGLSVEDVAADTRIRATLIRAIEADDYRLCGGNVYARGHIRSIARVVGVDPEPLIGDFDAAHDVERVVAAVAAQPTDHEIVSRSERHRPNWTAAMATALAVICLAALSPLIFRHHGGGGGQHATTPPTVVAHRSTASKAPVGPPPSAVAQLPVEKATMLVRTLHGKTWLSITTKTGKTLFSGLLDAGEQKVFTSRRGLVYVIGNAPAVDLVVNGHDIGEPPSSGGVVSRGNVTPGADTVQQA